LLLGTLNAIVKSSGADERLTFGIFNASGADDRLGTLNDRLTFGIFNASGADDRLGTLNSISYDRLTFGTFSLSNFFRIMKRCLSSKDLFGNQLFVSFFCFVFENSLA
jgi:hypothetical protein